MKLSDSLVNDQATQDALDDAADQWDGEYGPAAEKRADKAREATQAFVDECEQKDVA